MPALATTTSKSSTARRPDRSGPAAIRSVDFGFPVRGPAAPGLPFAKSNQKGEMTMTIRDLIPWNRSRDVAVHRGENEKPLLALHREMKRVFDDVFLGFDESP